MPKFEEGTMPMPKFEGGKMPKFEVSGISGKIRIGPVEIDIRQLSEQERQKALEDLITENIRLRRRVEELEEENRRLRASRDD